MAVTRSTRRAALGAILAVPLASMPVVAAPDSLSDDEVRFLALAPRLVPLLIEYDRVWAASKPYYEAYRKAADAAYNCGKHDATDLPEWHAYGESRERADEIDAIAEELYQPFWNVRFVSFEAILLRHRFAMAFDWAEEGAREDLTALWQERQFS